MKFNPGTNLLLKGKVGSHAFGLAHEGSDEDFQGIFVAPTQAFLGLSNSPQESFKYDNPDTTYHEVGKYCRLALKCNPTVLDLLWLEEYNVRTQLGTELINLRNNFLSVNYVRNSYFGYAVSQLNKLNKDPRPEKRAKNARHFYRLLYQGWSLYSTGTYSVNLGNMAGLTRLFGEKVGRYQELHYAEELLHSMEKKFNSSSPLPQNPNTEAVNEWLLKVRHEFYQYDNQGSLNSLEEFKEWP